MFVLDTNICIYAIRHRSQVVLKNLRQQNPSDVGVSSITVAELEYGVARSTRREENAEALHMFLAPVEILPFDDRAAVHYGRIRAELESKGTPIGGMDLLIAAHALSLSASIVTNDESEFRRVPGLEVVNWSK